MSLIKLGFIYDPKRHVTVSFITDRTTWNENLGKLLCAIKYMANVGSSREVVIEDFFDRRGTDDDRKLKSYIDGDGHFVFTDLRINKKLVPFSKMIKTDNIGETDFVISKLEKVEK